MSEVSGSPSQSFVPVFKGEGYEHWSIRMKTILMSKDLWDMIEVGITETNRNSPTYKEAKKKDAKALVFIQQGVHDQLFSRIASSTSAKESWETLKMEFQGDSQVQAVKLQGLRRDFENLQMKDGEMVGEYFSRVMAIVGQQRAFGEEITD
ncbi:uncharacterized protein LOC143575368 [Bidens hawaiensis]|uniref:uncharacterized protein LOC143575368 n=1 Tax=Bidens hawaiensis TaxID=980011 RepID=UPI0040499F72